ncbi:PLC-like phosphodiesterase [Chytriomyces sp. MP71]|nr:PLC-like phosphodiesterase [Chytriomyces sp. MP71]
MPLLGVGLSGLASFLFGPPAPCKLAAWGPSIQLLSHRGGSLEHIENTLPAFRRSASLGIPLILEMDICMTKDGHCVVFHDDDLGRLCGVPGKAIGDYDLADLPLLLVPDVLKGTVRDDDIEARRIPLFDEVLREFPSFPMQVDVKRGTESMILKVGNTIRHHRREHLTVWGSFASTQSALCYKHFGTNIPLLFSYQRMLTSWFLSWFGLTRAIRYHESAIIMPNLRWLMRPRWFEALNRAGVAVIVWGALEDVGKGPGGGINTVEGFERVK